jgi:hypothetical protein
MGRLVEGDAAVVALGEDAVEDDDVEVEVGIEGGAEAVQEGDGAELGVGLPRQQMPVMTLRHVTDPATQPRRLPRFGAQHVHVARVRARQVEQQSHGRALPGAVRAHQSG